VGNIPEKEKVGKKVVELGNLLRAEAGLALQMPNRLRTHYKRARG